MITKKAYVLDTPKKVKFKDFYLDDVVKEAFKLSQDVVKKVEISKDEKTYKVVIYFDTVISRKIEIKIESLDVNSFDYSMKVGNKAVRLDARLKLSDRKNFLSFFKKLDKIISIIPKKFNLEDNTFTFDNHKLIIQALDAVSSMIIV